MHPVAVDRLAWTLIHFVWQGALLAVLYAVARQCLPRRAGPNARYLLACVTLALMSFAPLVTWRALSPTTIPPVAARATRGAVVFASHQPAPSFIAPGLPSPVTARSRSLPQSLLPWIAALWCLGALFFWLRLVLGWLSTARLRASGIAPAPDTWPAHLARLQSRLAVTRSVRLFVSARMTAPAVLGWLRPVILAPACTFTGLAPEQIEAILLHELAHIRRHDYLVNLWQSAVEALLFYHPAVWWVSGQMRAEREFCCDDLAVVASGDALAYARALETLEAARPQSPLLAVAADGGPLLRRIARLLGRPSPANSPAAPLLLVAALLLGLAAFHGRAQTTPSFDVVSIHEWGPGQGPSGAFTAGVRFSPGRIHSQCASLQAILFYAYRLTWNDTIQGQPDWGKASCGSPDSRNTFEIEATMPPETTQDQSRLMVQSLLRDRFQLTAHWAEPEVPVFDLVIAAGGFKLQPSDPAQDKPTPRGFLRCTDDDPHCHTGICCGSLTLATLAGSLRSDLGRPVIDKTGLTAAYNFGLIRWRGDDSPNSSLPSLPTMLREQYGLELKPDTGKVKVFVIDHVEKPRSN